MVGKVDYIFEHNLPAYAKLNVKINYRMFVK